MKKLERCIYNPLIVPEDVKPSDPRFKVDGVFNCGVASYHGETILLCRVAESVRQQKDHMIEIPVVVNRNGKDEIDTVVYDKSVQTEFDYHDSRSITKENAKGRKMTVNLTSLSHLRIARSKDGVHFQIAEKPSIMPIAAEESWGMEDPRITQIGEEYYINYSSVTENGVCVSLIRTLDFETFERLGVIFGPENKDVTIFPEKIGGYYVALNRPVPFGIGAPSMWIAKSPDLLHWGEQKLFSAVNKEGNWDDGRVGGGAVPIKTEKGWLVIYHAADEMDRYCLGLCLLDLENPEKILARLDHPFMEPEADYEKEGFFGNVVFTCGALLEKDVVIIYYGAADDKICRADIALSDIFELLGV